MSGFKHLTAQGQGRIGKVWADRESLDNLRWFPDRPFHLMLKPRTDSDSIKIFSTTNSRPLDRRTNASGVSIRCFFGRVTVNEMVSPGLLGKSPEGRQPVHERFTPRRGLNRTRVVHDEAMHRKLTGGPQHEGHGSLPVWRIVEGL